MLKYSDDFYVFTLFAGRKSGIKHLLRLGDSPAANRESSAGE
jgi:hypothetical protein